VRLSKLLFIFSLLSLSTTAWAIEKTLCTVTSDMDSDYGKVVYEMDQDNRAIGHLYQDSYRNNVLVERIELRGEALREGIVLNRRDKYVTVRMHSDNYDSESGGILYLDTLYNGVSGERKEYEMALAMDKNGPVLIKNKINFTRMKFIAKRSKVFGIIGIEKVIFGE
jgi:hypothetical protein